MLSDVPLRGARRPRVCNYPAYVSSSGAEAVEIAASAGLVLDGWQGDILTAALGEREDGRWSAFEVAMIVSRQNGKGAVLEGRALAGLLLFDERLIMWTAHELKTAMEAFRRVEALFLNSDDLRRRVKKVSHANGDEGIELRNGARLRFVARSKGSGRGFSGDMVVLDEAYALTSDQIDALMPTLSARPNPQIWYASSPPLDAETGSQLMSVRRRGLVGGRRLAYFDWGVAGELEDLTGIDLDDRELWAGANPSFGIVRADGTTGVSEEFIAMERMALSPVGFARERLGVWPRDTDGSGGTIDAETWKSLRDPKSTMGDPIAFAVDMTPDRSFAAIAAAGRRTDGRMHVEVVEHARGSEWVLPRLKELTAKWKPCAVVVDASGPAGSLIAHLEAAGYEVLKPSARDAAQACGQLYDLATQGQLRHLDQPELNAALSGARRRELGDAWAWARKNASVDICPLVAATLALWGHSVRGHVAEAPFFASWR